MRFDIAATVPVESFPSNYEMPLSITLKPANCCPGTFEYKTHSRVLLRMLRCETEVSGFELAAFTGDLRIRSKARLRSVELKDDSLRKIGFFID